MSQAPEQEIYFIPAGGDSSLPVHLSLPLIHRLGFDILKSCKSAARSGLEIGGILLGSTDWEKPGIFADDYEIVDSEHQYGPQFVLSPRDQLVFEQAVSRRRNQPAGEPRPVGFFRSQTREGAEFDAQDAIIAHDLFGKEPSLCLLVKPSATEPTSAKVAVWSDGAFHAFDAFPFKTATLREGKFPILSLPATGARPPVAAAAMDPAEAAERPRWPIAKYLPRWDAGWVRDSAVLLGLAGVLIFAAFLTRSHGHTTPGSATSSTETQPATADGIALNVERRDNSAILTWDPESAALRYVDHALLIIRDSNKNQQLRLEPAELRTGRIVYVPESSDVSFRMQLFTRSGSSVESVRSLADAPRDDAIASQSPAGRAGEWAPPPRETIENNEEDDPPRAAAAKPAPPSPVVVTPPPAIAAVQPAPSLPALPVAPAPVPPPEEAAVPQDRLLTSVSVEPVGRSGLKRIWSKVSPERILHYSDQNRVISARPLREVQPKFPPEMIGDVRDGGQVDVKVTIGRRGQVLKTELKSHDVDDRIAFAVVRAAREWTFEPARNDNGPVEQQALLHFELR